MNKGLFEATKTQSFVPFNPNWDWNLRVKISLVNFVKNLVNFVVKFLRVISGNY